MTLTLVTAAVALFYASAVPLKLAFRYRSGSGFGFGAAPFEPRFAIRRAARPRRRRPRRRELRQRAEIVRAVCESLRHLKIDEFRLEGTVSCGDAALTALLCGGAGALDCALTPLAGRVRICIRPDFGEARADLSGMISVRVGHIIIAALPGILEYLSGRFKPWTSTPSKAS